MISKEHINEALNRGEIYVRKHSKYPLYLYKYTSSTVYSNNWNPLTLISRGLVLDEDYNIIAYPMTKFFNYSELSESVKSMIHNENFIVTEKLDGSLIQAFNYNGNLIVTSSGGFETEQANLAEKIIRNNKVLYETIIGLTNHNFVFELIAPLSKVVIDYNEEVKLVLITIISSKENLMGIEYYEEDILNIIIKNSVEVRKTYYEFESLTQLLDEVNSAEFKNLEGYVLNYQFDKNRPSYRVKLKYSEYFKLHKLVAGITPKRILDIIINEDMSEYFKNIPNEFLEEFEKIEFNLKKRFEEIKSNIDLALEEVKSQNFELRKDLAKYILNNFKDLSKFLFASIDGKEIEHLIWKKIADELKEIN